MIVASVFSRFMPPPAPVLLLEIILSRISAEPCPWMKIPPPLPPTQRSLKLLVMVFFCINDEPTRTPIPLPPHALLFVIMLFVILGEEFWTTMPPPKLAARLFMIQLFVIVRDEFRTTIPPPTKLPECTLPFC